MTDDTINLDAHRGMAAQKATDVRMRDILASRVDSWTRELTAVKGALEPKR